MGRSVGEAGTLRGRRAHHLGQRPAGPTACQVTRVQVAERGGGSGARVGGVKNFVQDSVTGFACSWKKGPPPPVGLGGFGGEVGL